jgi:hypothetical protein
MSHFDNPDRHSSPPPMMSNSCLRPNLDLRIHGDEKSHCHSAPPSDLLDLTIISTDLINIFVFSHDLVMAQSRLETKKYFLVIFFLGKDRFPVRKMFSSSMMAATPTSSQIEIFLPKKN